MIDIKKDAGSRDLGGTSVRRGSAAVAIATFCLVFLAMAPAAHACPITDLTCTIEAVEDVVDDTVDEVVQTTSDTVETVTGEASEVIDPIVDTAEETMETVEQIVDETVGGAEETVEQIVDETVGAAEETIDGTVGAVDEAVDQTVGPALEEPVAPGESNNGPSHGPESGGSIGGSGTVVLPQPVGVLPLSDPSSEGAAAVAAFSVAARHLIDDGVSGFLTVAEALAFPMALALVVGAFLMAQNQLDRRDPKLALAPVGPDVVGFA